MLHLKPGLTFAFAFLVLFAPEVRPQIYRCPQPDGSILMSDRACLTGEIREGNKWTSIREIEIRKAEEEARKRHDEERTREAESRRRQLEAQAAESRERELRARIEKQVELGRRPTAQSNAPTSDAVNRMTTYATVLGRAIGCNIDVGTETNKVGAWFDREFPLGKSKPMYLGILAEGMKRNSEMQRQGRSPDSCASIRSQIQSFPWP